MIIKIKKVYEKPDKEDGIRILVYRLWPQGLNYYRLLPSTQYFTMAST